MTDQVGYHYSSLKFPAFVARARDGGAWFSEGRLKPSEKASVIPFAREVETFAPTVRAPVFVDSVNNFKPSRLDAEVTAVENQDVILYRMKWRGAFPREDAIPREPYELELGVNGFKFMYFRRVAKPLAQASDYPETDLSEFYLLLYSVDQRKAHYYKAESIDAGLAYGSYKPGRDD